MVSTHRLFLCKNGPKDERRSDRDRLGFNSHQYVHEILILYLRPLYKKASGAEASVQTIEDGGSYHTCIYTEKYRKRLGIERMDWPSYSPDFNPIENVWLLFKTNYRKAVWERRTIPRSEKELIGLAQKV